MDGRAWRNFVLVYLTPVATRALGLWQQFMKTGLLICCFVLNLVPKLPKCALLQNHLRIFKKQTPFRLGFRGLCNHGVRGDHWSWKYSKWVC